MDKTLLISRPMYDDGTEYLSAYSINIIKTAKENNFFIKDLIRENANKLEIEKFLKKKKCNLIFLNGHGEEDKIYGNKDEVIFSEENVELLKNKIVYARACSAGKKLGKQIVEDSEGCFIGYKFPFYFWTEDKWSTKPLNDKSASLYLNPSNEIMNQFIKGKTALEADKISKKMMIENMNRLLVLKDKNQPEAMNMLQCLWTNYKGQVLLGNKNAKI